MLSNILRPSKGLKAVLAASAAIFCTPAAALNIFVCQPEWQALISAHAPDANIFSATTARQDPHYVQARPSLIAKMRQADLAMCSGAELEIGWLPMLQSRSGNLSVQNDAETMIFASDHVAMLDTHQHVDRSMGDIHAHGNPHVQFAINDIPELSKVVTQRLQALDPGNAHQYQARGIRFRANWRQHVNEWRELSKPLKGKKVVGQHATYRYLFKWLDIEQVADLEPKPGLSPTTAHLQSLTRLDKASYDAIVFSSHQDHQPAEWLHRQTGKPVIKLPLTVSGNEQLTDLVDQTLAGLLEVLVVNSDQKSIEQ
ncbi:metal ABC transporter solute-binding protein, Zn/Mn family [Endozoicomonas elysicola]|uniref:Zinc ABC transporter substrate-binding protein n=1 Tax=Endozoicomonas elysicola TaxID=305900 RepID=A0A081K851_9GAMM|nr:zinc ABC transporter substrate-binding protein [Endozoicomonas elysicola]KEI70327.1 zinc ABC transporter substrate-binding protein [Endozoicomonas elysicola]